MTIVNLKIVACHVNRLRTAAMRDMCHGRAADNWDLAVQSSGPHVVFEMI